VFALGAAVARDPEPDQGQGDDDRNWAEEQRQDDDDHRGEGDEEGERAGAAALAAAGAVDDVADHHAAERRAGEADQRAEDAVEQEADDEADHRGEDRHAAERRAVRAGRAGEHPDRDADAEVGEDVHVRKPSRLGEVASIRHTWAMTEVPQHPQRRRAHTSTRDLERYAGLFAERTSVMRSSAMRDLMAITARPEVISLAGGLPDTSSFPPQSFAAQMTRIAQESAAEALQYGPTEGFEETKDCILQVMGAEGMLPDLDDIIVTTGGQQAIDLVCKTLVDPGDVVICEAPTYPGAVPVFCSYQAEVMQVECDDDGMRIDALEALLEELRGAGRRPKFVYSVPSFQNPAGVTMSLERRQRLVELARRNEMLVVEDNPYGLLRYGGEPMPPLYQLDGGDFVIYLGTFSKILSPGIRLGWAVAPPPVMEKIVLGKQATDLCTSTLTQYFVREYFAEGRWQRYIEDLIEIYRGRRDTMIEALRTHFPAEATWTEPQGGLFIWATLPDYIDTGDLLAKALRADVAFVPGQAAYVDGRGRHSMRLNFSGVDEGEIREGVRRIGKVIAEQVELYEALTGEHRVPTPADDAQAPNVLPFRKAEEA
jgi:2-aminoadipate transaminase